MYIPFQTPYLFSLGAVASLVGIVVGAYGLTQMLLRIPIGIAADKYSRQKSFILMGVLFAASASILRVLFASPTAFLIANMLSGTASAMWISFTVFFSSLYKEDEQKKAMGYSIAAHNGGILLGFIVGSVVNDVWGIKFVFIASILAGVLATLITGFIKEAKPSTGIHADIHPLTIFKSRPLIVYSLLGIGLQAIIPSTALSFTMSYVKQFTNQEFLLGICSVSYTHLRRRRCRRKIDASRQ